MKGLLRRSFLVFLLLISIFSSALAHASNSESMNGPENQPQINKIVTEVCKKINIQLDKSNYKNAVVGLPYNIPFVKKSVKVLKCPNCGEKLMFLMPDGKFLSCNNCDKCYINNNGNVGNETVLPDNGNEVLY